MTLLAQKSSKIWCRTSASIKIVYIVKCFDCSAIGSVSSYVKRTLSHLTFILSIFVHEHVELVVLVPGGHGQAPRPPLAPRRHGTVNTTVVSQHRHATRHDTRHTTHDTRHTRHTPHTPHTHTILSGHLYWHLVVRLVSLYEHTDKHLCIQSAKSRVTETERLGNWSIIHRLMNTYNNKNIHNKYLSQFNRLPIAFVAQGDCIPSTT